MSEYPPASCDIHPRVGKLEGFYYNTYNKYAIMNDPEKKTNNVNVMLYWLKKLGYSDASACACIGCAMYESQMNPAAWEFQDPDSPRFSIVYSGQNYTILGMYKKKDQAAHAARSYG